MSSKRKPNRRKTGPTSRRRHRVNRDDEQFALYSTEIALLHLMFRGPDGLGDLVVRTDDIVKQILRDGPSTVGGSDLAEKCMEIVCGMAAGFALLEAYGEWAEDADVIARYNPRTRQEFIRDRADDRNIEADIFAEGMARAGLDAVTDYLKSIGNTSDG